MEFLSTRAAITRVRLAGVRRFMVWKTTSELGTDWHIEPGMSRNKIDKLRLILLGYVL
jgi:hypothetical protein